MQFQTRCYHAGVFASIFIIQYALVGSLSALEWPAQAMDRTLPKQTLLRIGRHADKSGYSTSATRGHKTMYLVDVSVGSPMTSFRLLVDTGSSLLLVPAGTCNSSACRAHRRFDGSKSHRTGRWVNTTFGKGSIFGHAFEDQICLPSSGGLHALHEIGLLQWRVGNHLSAKQGTNDSDTGHDCAQMSFVAVDEQSKDFDTAPYDGILGLGLENLPIGHKSSSFLTALAEAQYISSTDFALRLGNHGDSELLLGDIDIQRFANEQVLWVSLSELAGDNWQFRVMDIAIDGRRQNLGSFEVLVDSGTSLLAADEDMKLWFEQHLQPTDCLDVSRLPKVSLLLSETVSLSLFPADYIDQVDRQCNLALMPDAIDGHNQQSLILGDSFLRRYITIFSQSRRQLGFGVAIGDEMSPELLTDMFPDRATNDISSDLLTTMPEESSGSMLGLDEILAESRSPLQSSQEDRRDRERQAMLGLDEILAEPRILLQSDQETQQDQGRPFLH